MVGSKDDLVFVIDGVGFDHIALQYTPRPSPIAARDMLMWGMKMVLDAAITGFVSCAAETFVQASKALVVARFVVIKHCPGLIGDCTAADTSTRSAVVAGQSSRNGALALQRMKERVLSHRLDRLKTQLAIDDRYCGATTDKGARCRVLSPARAKDVIVATL